MSLSVFIDQGLCRLYIERFDWVASHVPAPTRVSPFLGQVSPIYGEMKGDTYRGKSDTRVGAGTPNMPPSY